MRSGAETGRFRSVRDPSPRTPEKFLCMTVALYLVSALSYWFAGVDIDDQTLICLPECNRCHRIISLGKMLVRTDFPHHPLRHERIFAVSCHFWELSSEQNYRVIFANETIHVLGRILHVFSGFI